VVIYLYYTSLLIERCKICVAFTIVTCLDFSSFSREKMKGCYSFVGVVYDYGSTSFYAKI